MPLELYEKLNQVLNSDFKKIITIGLISRIIVVLSAIFATTFVGMIESPPYVVHMPLVKYFSNWDTGHYCSIALFGYPNQTNPLSINWAWFPLYPFLMNVVGRIFFGVMSTSDSVTLAGFLISNFLFFVNLILFFKLSLKILENNKTALLSTVFFAFFPGSLFYSCVYSESLFMTLVLGTFIFLEKGKNVISIILGFLVGLTRSSGFLISSVFFHEGFRKRKFWLIVQGIMVFTPYLLFNLYGYLVTGLFPIRDSVISQYWESPTFIFEQFLSIDLGYALLFFIEFCLILVPFLYLFHSKELIKSVFSFGLKGNRKDAKYYSYSLLHLVVILFVSVISNIHRYAIPILPIYWVYARIWNKKPKVGLFSLLLMICILFIGTMLYSTWRWYW